MLNPDRLSTRIRDVFDADPRQPAILRQALIAFRELVYREPRYQQFDSFVNIVRFRLEVSGALAERHSRLMPLRRVFDELWAQWNDGTLPIFFDHAYHNYPHTMMVTTNRVGLGRVERGMAGKNWGVADHYRQMRGAIICLTHDVLHPGLANAVPAQIEQQSYNYLDPILTKCGVPVHERKFIEQVVLLTDPALPGEILKYGAAFHGFGENILHLPREIIEERINVTPDAMQPKLAGLLYAVERNRELVEEALLTKAADMAASFGLRIDFCNEDSLNVQKEMQAANPAHVISTDDESVMRRRLFVALNFVGARREPDGTISATFMHPAADKLFGPVLKQLEAEARAILPPEVTAGIEAGLKDHIVSAPRVKRSASQARPTPSS